VRTGQHDADTARVVLDFDDLQDYKVFSLYDPFRVIVDVYAHGRNEAATVADATPAATPAPAPKAAAKPAPKGPLTPPSKDSKKLVGDLVEQLGLTVNTIMIDAGHGGKDPGAMASGLKERTSPALASRRPETESPASTALHPQRRHLHPLEKEQPWPTCARPTVPSILATPQEQKRQRYRDLQLNWPRPGTRCARPPARTRLGTQSATCRSSDDLMLNSKVKESKTWPRVQSGR
jgi:hypothetical protein